MSKPVKYRMPAPDGKVYEIEGPPGATDAEVRAEIVRQFPHLAQFEAPKREEKPRKASSLDKLMAHPVVRFATGAAELPLGLAQLGAELGASTAPSALSPSRVLSPVARALTDYLQEGQRMRERGMEARGDRLNVAGGLGSLASGVALGVAAGKAIPMAAGALGRIGQGAAYGAAAGAASPVTDPDESFGEQKARQVALGAALGGLIPAGVEGAKLAAKTGQTTIDVLTGTKPALARLRSAYYRRLVGEENAPVVAQWLRTPTLKLPGYSDTAAERLHNITAASPIIEQQRITAQTPGGISGLFGARRTAQDIALRSAEIERDMVTAPMRDAALSKAGQNFGRARNQLANALNKIAKDPQVDAVSPIRKMVDSIADDAVGAQTPEALYGVRQYISDLIGHKTKLPETVPKYAGKVLINMRDAIDDAIKAGGAGSSWDDYLKEYSQRTAVIDAVRKRAETMYKPVQPTSLQNAQNITEHTGQKLPPMLERTAMIANHIAKLLRRNVEPKLDEAMANDLLNPDIMAAVMSSMPRPAAAKFYAYLVKQYPTLATVAASQAARQE